MMRILVVTAMVSLAFVPVFGPSSATGAQPLVIALDADMSSGSAQSGEAIRRGIVLAIDEINAAGGVLGHPMELTVRDHRGNPARGADNIEELAGVQNLLAIVSGLHTPVALNQLEAIHKHKIPFLVPWAAGTEIVDNEYHPNYVFRVSVKDALAGAFLVGKVLAAGHDRPGLLLERTGWGRSNEAALMAALENWELLPAGIEWFNWGASTEDFKRAYRTLIAGQAEVVILVSNPREGVKAVEAMASFPADARLPIVSHWGITGADFPMLAGNALDSVDLTILQTYSFFDPPFADRADKLVAAYCRAFGDCDGPKSVFSPAGTAHAYDLVQLLARAVLRAGTTDRVAVRRAMENLAPYRGLVRNYDPPFTETRHDALDSSDFRLARFGSGGAIVPTGQ